jgi:hypothetical protein
MVLQQGLAAKAKQNLGWMIRTSKPEPGANPGG